MCGIFALLNNSTTFQPKTVKNSFMLGVNRGPEQSVLKYNDDDVYLGFHRLAINGLNPASGQPMTFNNITLICNGEIYNYKELYTLLEMEGETDSDCEVIIHLYARFGLEYTLQLLDGVFAFVLHDLRDDMHPSIHVARDPYGVRPLYMVVPEPFAKAEPIFAFASELKVLHSLCSSSLDIHAENAYNNFHFSHVMPGTYLTFQKNPDYTEWLLSERTKYHTYKFINDNGSKFINDNGSKFINDNGSKFINDTVDLATYETIYAGLAAAVKKRVVGTSDRKIACLLSGGLDSSLIAALVHKYYDGELETYSIGMPGSEDVKYAEIVAQHLGTKHTSIIVSEADFFEAIPEVIRTIESYDTTSVRASVGNYLLGKYIKANSEAKVIFNGDGSDELTGGYLYFKAAPSDAAFDLECKRLLANIYAFDVLRSDKSISSHGLEPRTPFLDRGFVDYYLSLPAAWRNTNKTGVEKQLLRQAVATCDPTLLPRSVLWRKKEAFSDGVSSLQKSWYQIIEEKITALVESGGVYLPVKTDYKNINLPTTLEQAYYRFLYEIYYPNTANIVPYFWMPRFVNATDASARTLAFYNED
jgi:asparagine synthase (glutamine-hydrolysing)